MAQFVSDCLRIMALTLGRRNQNDPDSSNATFLGYLNNFINLTMSDDLRVFEQYGTLTFTIDQTNTTGVYTFNDVGASSQFTNISNEGFITLEEPIDGSVSWNFLEIFQDPGEFFGRWGVNNTDILIPGFPTEMLYYGEEFTFRTIPNTSYQVVLYGYKVIPEFSEEGNPEIPHAYWLRYLAYGAAFEYAMDYRFSAENIARINAGYSRERKLLLTRMQNQIKHSRAKPRY